MEEGLMKIAVVYYSESGNTKRIAEAVAEGAQILESVQTRIMSLDELDPNWIEASSAVIVGSPTYAGSLSWQIKRFLDTTDIKFEGKIGAVFATESHLGGGADFAELVMIGALLVRGMLVYSAGATKGEPFTHFGAVSIRDGDEGQKHRARLFGKRIAEKALDLFEPSKSARAGGFEATPHS
jgi:NAD(P)H dehydrogenase (quinone)